MTRFAIALLLGMAFLCAQDTQSAANQQPKPAKIGGKVVSSTTGEPVRKATLTLRPSTNPTQTQTATSEADGSFAFENLSPGTYALHAEKPGFVRQYYGARRAMSSGTPLKLAEGQDLKSIDFKLVPQGVISGTVTDEDGEPMAGVRVQPMQYGYLSGKRQLRTMGGA